MESSSHNFEGIDVIILVISDGVIGAKHSKRGILSFSCGTYWSQEKPSRIFRIFSHGRM